MDYARDRKQFGVSIGNFQMVQALLADMYTDLETMRALTYQLGREIQNISRGEGGRGVVHKRSAAAVLHAGRASMRVLDSAVQIHGGNGYAEEYPISRVLVDSRILNVFEGTGEIQAQIIARRLLERN